MHCATCGAEALAPSETCGTCGASPLLEGTYRLESVLGRGAHSTTWAATRLEDDAAVVAKELPLRAVDEWAVVERFRREAAILRQLEHPDIPRFIDELEAGDGRSRSVWLIQDRVHGQSLEDELAHHRYDEAEVRLLVEKVARVLAYLHDRRPAVIHRDVKPANLVRRTEDGGLSLVDFGAVRDRLQDPNLGGRTVVGTFGYMAPEQMKGDAFPASDVYGLGATALRLLTREEPRQLIGYDGRVKPEALLGLSVRTRDLIEGMMAPDPSDRPQDGAALLKALTAPARGTSPRIVARAESIQLPPGADVPRSPGRAPTRTVPGPPPIPAPAAAALPPVSTAGARALHVRKLQRLMLGGGIALIIAGFAMGFGSKVGIAGIILTVFASHRRDVAKKRRRRLALDPPPDRFRLEP